MEDVENELALLKQDIENMQNTAINHPIFAQICEWEQESTNKIQIASDIARADLFQLLAENANRIESDFNRIAQQMQSNHNSNYSKDDCDQRIDEIKTCRQNISKTLQSVKLITDHKIKPIQLIKITESGNQQDSAHNNDVTISSSLDSIPSSAMGPSHDVGKILSKRSEYFEKIAGNAELDENCLVAKKTDVPSASIRGTILYSTGTHQIRFRVEHLSNNSIFIGVTPSTEQMTTTTFKLPSSFGWWDTKFPVIRGIQVESGAFSMHTGDEISLTIDCNEARLVYHNKRSGLRSMTVNLDFCPLPWQLLVVLGAGENKIRILP
ncbi:unnamed protein product [Rotaria magnacalcarata]|uniref:B30.2/SPRY domain-containing protein n=1 Tax=Rotaria magnacalcarata TaxID=392030 RepID=A0A815ZR05_9BILA|nr:unnamed protein product [Rotaria magnacalcarata]CAF1587450.1 unnamed protein product [Rotaria magnacalcarata]CAF1920440.1 unnamed protein product [Rotaria magnacalcarata]CAF4014319.1 unnamed protein product [Rotaria magnacalcarata]CAF4036558.1 unnamed protein product [Rotaria magnacalcarata]